MQRAQRLRIYECRTITAYKMSNYPAAHAGGDRVSSDYRAAFFRLCIARARTFPPKIWSGANNSSSAALHRIFMDLYAPPGFSPELLGALLMPLCVCACWTACRGREEPLPPRREFRGILKSIKGPRARGLSRRVRAYQEFA